MYFQETHTSDRVIPVPRRWCPASTIYNSRRRTSAGRPVPASRRSSRQFAAIGTPGAATRSKAATARVSQPVSSATDATSFEDGDGPRATRRVSYLSQSTVLQPSSILLERRSMRMAQLQVCLTPCHHRPARTFRLHLRPRHRRRRRRHRRHLRVATPS